MPKALRQAKSRNRPLYFVAVEMAAKGTFGISNGGKPFDSLREARRYAHDFDGTWKALVLAGSRGAFAKDKGKAD